MNISHHLEKAANVAIASVMNEVKGVHGAVVATGDGFEIAAKVENTAQVSRLAAMASSIAALGAVAGEESQLGVCDHVLIEATQGYIVMRQIRRDDMDLILSVVAGRDAVVGQLVYFTRSAAQTLSQA